MSKLTIFFTILWFVSLTYGEWFSFLIPSRWSCSWPHLHRPSSSVNGSDHATSHFKIAVITDPQLMDRTSLPLAPKSLALDVAQFYADLYMRRAFLLSIMPFNPDAVLFLGDYFDGGTILSDEEWKYSSSRFRHIFNLNLLQQTSNVKVRHLSGNHDIGYAALNYRNPEIIERHEREFGARNFKIRLGKVDFIAVDGQTLDGHPENYLTSDTWNFIRNVSKEVSSTPRVLLIHIPLYRPDWSPCGTYRSSSVINQRIRYTDRTREVLYQNYISENSTNTLLELIRPSLVLSGHDHDQCTLNHTSKYGPVSEHTLGTVSWQQGNLHPSFMLLSASNSEPSAGTIQDNAILTHLCFLPMQTHIYLWYLLLFTTTLVVLVLGPTHEIHVFNKLHAFTRSIRNLLDFSNIIKSVKEKNEEEYHEYEEIWDAEGSMHLIKKTFKSPLTASNDKNPTERGSAVMRSAAKKQAVPETDISINVGFDVKSAHRTQRSRGRLIMWRLFWTVRALVMVAVINVPLYVFLVFKDWIDK